MTCDCGAATTRQQCEDCELAERYEGAPDHDDPECPTCGGRTSGAGVECAGCRRGDGLRADGGRIPELGTAIRTAKRKHAFRSGGDTRRRLNDYVDLGEVLGA
jgi:hypothetical protein